MRSPATVGNYKPPRPGYLYIAVLFTTLLVSTVGLVALTNASLRMKSASDRRDFMVAQALAATAIEAGLFELRSADRWRADLVHNTEYPSGGLAFGQGTFAWKLLDEDGDLSDDDSDSVRLVGIGRVGNVVAAESVRLLPSGAPLSCLESAFHCDGNIAVNGTALRFSTQQHISSNGNISVSGLLTSLDGDVEAVGSISGTINGSRTESAAARRLPGSSAFDYYLDNGTWIDVTALPQVDGRRQISQCVLNATNNPFGPTNPEAIYVVDCVDQEVRITDCRVNATLVLLRPASSSAVRGAIRWDAAVANYPALLVAGSIRMELDAAELSEASLGVNFNPSGVPYAGITDQDRQDAYPSDINGLVYISGNMNAVADGKDSIFRGSVICASINAHSNCHFTYRELLYSNPPPGFAFGNPMLISPGSRRQETLQP